MSVHSMHWFGIDDHVVDEDGRLADALARVFPEAQVAWDQDVAPHLDLHEDDHMFIVRYDPILFGDPSWKASWRVNGCGPSARSCS